MSYLSSYQLRINCRTRQRDRWRVEKCVYDRPGVLCGEASPYTRSTSVPLTLQLDTTEAGGHLGSSAGHPRLRLSLIGPCQHVPPSVLVCTYVPYFSALERLYSVASSRGPYGGEKIGWH